MFTGKLDVVADPGKTNSLSLNEKTPIPLGLAILAIGGGAIWLTTVQFTQAAHGKALETLSKDQRVQSEVSVQMLLELREIRGELKRLFAEEPSRKRKPARD